MKEIGDDEIALFDVMKETIPNMDPERKQLIGNVLMVLLSCAEDDVLNLDRLAELAQLTWPSKEELE